MSLGQVLFFILLGYSLNAFVLFAFAGMGGMDTKTPHYKVLQFLSVIPFGAALGMSLFMLLLICSLVLLSIPFCILSGIGILVVALSQTTILIIDNLRRL